MQMMYCETQLSAYGRVGFWECDFADVFIDYWAIEDAVHMKGDEPLRFTQQDAL
jgi:hypothetical protein